MSFTITTRLLHEGVYRVCVNDICVGTARISDHVIFEPAQNIKDLMKDKQCSSLKEFRDTLKKALKYHPETLKTL